MKSRSSWESLLTSTTPRPWRESLLLSLFWSLGVRGNLSPGMHCDRNDCTHSSCNNKTPNPNLCEAWHLLVNRRTLNWPACLCQTLVPGGVILWKIQQTVTSPGTKDQPIADGQFAACFELLRVRLYTDILGHCQYLMERRKCSTTENKAMEKEQTHTFNFKFVKFRWSREKEKINRWKRMVY